MRCAVYKLLVYHAGENLPHATILVARAAEVLDRIPEVLAQHHTCEHVVVTHNDVRLFAVDCAGNRLP
jgi:hypothetical protein